MSEMWERIRKADEFEGPYFKKQDLQRRNTQKS